VIGERQSRHGSPYRILVVEDDLAVSRFLEALLLDRGYQVLQARNGVDALIALTAPRLELPHAVILDLGLPLESGVSVLSFLRSVMRSGVPVIVLTGRQDPDEEAAVRALGVSAFLRKPASPEQVLHSIASVLD
jgi:type IV pili sensor histidine kinase/response regulator